MDWTQIILAVLTLLTAVVTGVLVPWVRSELDDKQLTKLDYWMNLLVAAAETEYNGEAMGKQKKEWVLQQMKNLGLKFDEAAVSAAIDGLVRELTTAGVVNEGK